jgi:hypothetical protein
MTDMTPAEAVYFAAAALPPPDRAAYLANRRFLGAGSR